jgi:AbrB family looped-hinge helix DNA binding protein
MKPILYFFDQNSYYWDMKSRVSEKGQVTVPKKIRDEMGIRAGDSLDFHVRNGEIVGHRVAAEIPWDEVCGMLKTDATTDELMRDLRGAPLW